MAPIRLGIIGLSSSAVTSWASSAHLPYLLSARGRSKYTIVALCNSSVESAKKAIQFYGLDPAGTRAYGDPAALAADPDLDLVVCCTRVDTHYALIKPSIDAGKNVFVEWPLTHDVERSQDLADAAAHKGLYTMVGLQGRLAPVFLKIKELVRGGSLGRVLSSEVRAFGGTIDRETVVEGLKYFAQRSVGGNILMIGFAHLFDSVQSVLGEATGVQSHLQLQRPTMKLRDASGKIVGEVASNVPDLILATSSLKPSDSVQDGASLHISFRRGQQFKGEPALTWHINCERGEVRLVSPSGASVHASSYSAPVTIDVHDFAADEVRREQWEWPAWQEEIGLPVAARSIAKLYEAFYDHVSEGHDRDYPDFSDALSRHQQISSMLAGWGSAS